MPEQQICLHCKKPIDMENDNYVIPNKYDHNDLQTDPDTWRFAHSKCELIAKNKNS